MTHDATAIRVAWRLWRTKRLFYFIVCFYDAPFLYRSALHRRVQRACWLCTPYISYHLMYNNVAFQRCVYGYVFLNKGITEIWPLPGCFHWDHCETTAFTTLSIVFYMNNLQYWLHLDRHRRSSRGWGIVRSSHIHKRRDKARRSQGWKLLRIISWTLK